MTQITNTGQFRLAAISPDGKYLSVGSVTYLLGRTFIL
jgi:hypothetical protein